MGMLQSFPDDRPVIPRLSRYVIVEGFGRGVRRASTLGDMYLDHPTEEWRYLIRTMPPRWNDELYIEQAREAFADYCRRRGL